MTMKTSQSDAGISSSNQSFRGMQKKLMDKLRCQQQIFSSQLLSTSTVKNKTVSSKKMSVQPRLSDINSLSSRNLKLKETLPLIRKMSI